MFSHRIGKDGKKLPSVSSSNWQYEQWKRDHPEHAFPRHTHACAWGASDDDVNAWAQKRLTTILGQNTSLGKPPLLALVPQKEHTQEELNLYLVQHNHLAVGDWVTYKSYLPEANVVSLYTVNHIIYIEKDITKVRWDKNVEHPQCFLCINGSPMDPKASYPTRGYWNNGQHFRHLTSNEYTKLLKNNDKLPDYLLSIKAHLKAGTLKIG